MAYDPILTTKAFKDMIARQGGGLLFHREDERYPDTSETYTVATRIPEGYKPFDISIYNSAADETLTTLRLIVNPTDIQIGQAYLGNNALTRGGWVSSLWGRQQATISASGVTPAFYISSSGFTRPVNTAGMIAGTVSGGPLNEGLVNYKRRDTLAFINLQTLVAFFKNNATYVLTDPKEKTIYKDRNRVINVMDSVLISYDSTEYMGSFSSFTLDETADKPYNMSYVFEFVVSGYRGDMVEGHIHEGDNNKNSSVNLSVQGDDTKFVQVLYMDVEQLNKEFKLDEAEIEANESRAEAYQYSLQEAKDESSNSDSFRKIDPNTVVVTSTGIGPSGSNRPDHAGKIDYRTGSGQILALTGGRVVQVKTSPDHYVVVQVYDKDGKPTGEYIRYYHLDPASFSVSEGSEISQGDPIGSEFKTAEQVNSGGGQINTYAPHCDVEMKQIDGEYKSGSWQSTGTRVDISGTFINAVSTFNANANSGDTRFSDYTTIQYRNSGQVIKSNDPKVQGLYAGRTNIVNP